MKKLFLLFLLFSFLSSEAQDKERTKKQHFVLVIHGGAGSITRENMTQGAEKAYTESLQQALQAGYAILNKGGSALDAVEASVRLMEDNPLFNAGKGAVFTDEGKAELDASIMNGKTLAAGAVAGVGTIKNPVSAARAVMEKSRHVLLSGRGAEKFAAQQGLDMVDSLYFRTRIKALPKEKQPVTESTIYGTVGAVALDRQGNLAAATSTGGTSRKMPGRIGDSPIIGAGTYADNNTCAISCTGQGEYFIRLVVAKTVSDLMEFKHFTVQQAGNEMILERVPQLGGEGGLIAVDKNGHIALPFNTSGMFRGYISEDGRMVVKMFRE